MHTTTTVKEFFEERYAPLHGLSARTIKIYQFTIDRFEEFLQRTPVLSDLNDLTVSRFLQWRRNNKSRPVRLTTVLKDRTQLLAIANHAAKKKLLSEFLTLPPLRTAGKLPRAYLVEDLQKLITAAGNQVGQVDNKPAAWWWQCIILTCLETAGRIGEIRDSLTWGCVDAQRCSVVFLAETRKGQTRDVERQISQRLVELLEQHRGADNEPVFHWDRQLTSLWYEMKKLCTRANVPNYGFHGFRKSAASLVAKHSGTDKAQKLLDHSAVSTTENHYLDSRIVGLAASVSEVLPAFNLGIPDKEPGQ